MPQPFRSFFGTSRLGSGEVSNGDRFTLAITIDDSYGVYKPGHQFTVTEDREDPYRIVLDEGTKTVYFSDQNGMVVSFTGNPKTLDRHFNLLERVATPEPVVEAPVVKKPEPKTVKIKTVKGDKGDKGEQGSKGFDGEKGERGEPGPAGPQGPAGERGEVGSQGPQGEKGEKGDVGPQGEKGEAGAQGQQGEQGEAGARGETGARGERGERGAQGEKGETGSQGPRGEAGSQGLKGDTGERGPRGIKGERGAPGPRGPQGLAGLKGERGERGEKGDKGDQGEPGLVVAQYPLVYDSEKRTVSIELNNLEERINKIFAPLAKKNFDTSKLDWLAASGGAVAIKKDGRYIKTIVADIDFRGTGVTVTDGGKDTIVTINSGALPDLLDYGYF
jgi:hypothetical protein